MVEEVDTGCAVPWSGSRRPAVCTWSISRDRHGRTRGFPLGPGFLVDGEAAVLTPPQRAAATALAEARRAQSRTASGSTAVRGQRAAVAAASRLFVEVVTTPTWSRRCGATTCASRALSWEMLDGVDDSRAAIAAFGPGPGRRMGVLADHLVPGTKESGVVDAVRALPGARGHVKVLGHPYVDVWQSVRPSRLGLDVWPVVPRGQDWKHGICAAFGWPHDNQADIAQAWKRILGRVRSYADLEPTPASVEELIDFVTDLTGGQGRPDRPCPDPGIDDYGTPDRLPAFTLVSPTGRRPTTHTTKPESMSTNQPYGPTRGQSPATGEERTASILAHLSAIIAAILTAGWLSFVGPLRSSGRSTRTAARWCARRRRARSTSSSASGS